jgi:hypothetical protein
MITKRNLLAAAFGAAFTRRAAAQEQPQTGRSDAGAIGAQVAGRVVVSSDGLLQVLVYFLYVDGIGSDLFNGTPSERTAYFTLRTDLLRPASVIPNGDVVHIGLQPAPGSEGLYRLYYNALPNSRDFSRPETFAQGVQIAAFRTRRAQCTVIPGSHSLATGTADIVSQSDFTFRGQSVDSAKVYPALTFEFHYRPIPVGELGLSSFSLPFGGHILKVG